MAHRSILPALALVAVALVCALTGLAPAQDTAAQDAAQDTGRPDVGARTTRVLLVDMDDVGHDLLSLAHTPRLDELAKTGRFFTTFVTSPSCSPSRAMLHMGAQTSHPDVLMGRVLLDTRHERTAYTLEPKELTPLAGLVQAAGRTTVKLGKWHLCMPEDAANTRTLGWQRYAGVMGNLRDEELDYLRYPKVQDGEIQLVEGRYLTTDETDDALAAIDARTDLISLSYHACHGPWSVPPLALLSAKSRAALKALGGPDAWAKLTPAEVAPLMLEALDHEVGRLVDAAREAGYTAFVFGDNGSSSFVGGDKKGFSDSGVVAPLWVAGPAVAPGTDPSLVSIADLYGTVAELMGIERSPATQGPHSLSMVSALQGGAHGREYAAAEIFGRLGDSPRERQRMRWTRMLRSTRYKLVWHRKGGEELSFYDLLADPGEEVDLLEAGELEGEAAAAFARMRAQMEADVAGSGREVTVSTSASAGPAAEPKTKILLVDLDDVGHAAVAAARTPTLDALRKSGRYYPTLVTAPTCSPSRAMLQTGAWCSHPDVLVGRVLRNKYKGSQAYALPVRPLQPLATFVASSGRTTAKVGKWHLSQASEVSHPIECGWQSYQGVISNLLIATDTYESFPKVTDGKTERLEGRYITSDETDDAIAAIGNNVDLVSLSYHAPHKPWHVPPAKLLEPRLDVAGQPMEIQGDGLSDEQLTLLMLEACDHELARVLAAAESHGYTVFVFGDNGGQNSRDETGGKGTFLDTGIVVPLWVTGPGVLPGEDSALVSMVDFYATIAELLGIERDPKSQGPHSQSFAASLSGGPTTRWYAYSEIFDKLGEDPRSRMNIQWQRAVRTGRYKLFQNRGAGYYTFVDLEADPGEEVNLLESLPLAPAAKTAYDALFKVLASI